MEVQPAARWYPLGVRQPGPVGSLDRQRRVELLAPSTQEALDCITCLAGAALDVAAVFATLVDAERRLLISSYGLPVPAALLVSSALRKHVVTSRRPLVVADGRRDRRLARNPAVRDGTVRACVAVPLGMVGGPAVGALLAVDPKPRRWTAPQLELLGSLSAVIVSEMRLSGALSGARASEGSSQGVPVF